MKIIYNRLTEAVPDNDRHPYYFYYRNPKVKKQIKKATGRKKRK